MRRRVALGAISFAPLAFASAASACPMCLASQGGGTGEAFALGSLLLSVTPLAVIGGAVWYLRRRARALAEAARAEAIASHAAPH
jgi:hypothetical protein